MVDDFILPYSIERPSSKKSLPRDRSKIWLDKNENFDDLYINIHKKIISDLDVNVIAAYPEMTNLYGKLASFAGVQPSNLLLTHGSDGAICATFRSLVREGDLVAYTSPTFAMYPVYTSIHRARSYEFKYQKNAGQIYLDLDEIISFIKTEKPKVIFLPNPDSPTGTVLKEEEFKVILNACEVYRTFLMIDEAYHPFYKWSAVPWISQSSVLIVARTFSKAWGAAGVRVGYAVACPNVIKLMNMVRPMYEIGSLASEFIFNLLDYEHEMYSSVERIGETKKFFADEMLGLGFDVLRSYANFLHVNFGDRNNVVQKALEPYVLYRQSFDDQVLRGYSRFTIGPKNIMSKVVTIIKNAN
jgi:histidinol-phosphate aminotransferase